jgi:hypothetical protein
VDMSFPSGDNYLVGKKDTPLCKAELTRFAWPESRHLMTRVTR